MDFLLITLFYLLFGISILLTLFLVFSFFDLMLDPYKKTSEAIIMLVGGCLLGIGLYVAYQQGYVPVNFLRGSVILVLAFIIALISILVGLIFFNGPLHWQ
mgnify:CR=1 FL=1